MNALALRIVEPIAEPQRVTGLQGVGVRLQGARLRLDSLLSFPILFLFRMAKQVTFYYHKDCEGCDELKPLIKRAAKMKGYTFRQVNVEKCKTRFCDSLQYVPTVVLNDKKLNMRQIENFLDSEL